MRIEDITEGKGYGGKKELGAAEKWLFDKENGDTRLKSLIGMKIGQQGVAELKEFEPYGTNAKGTAGIAISLNRVFIQGKIPLIARGRKDGIAIIKVEKFKLDNYGKADKRPMGSNHIQTLKDKLAEVLA